MGHAKAPLLLEEGRAVRYQFRPIRQSEDMSLQFGYLHPSPDGDAVAYDMKIRTLKIYNALALGILYIGVRNGPFLRHRPVEHGGPGRKLLAPDRDVLRQHVYR